MRFTSSIIRLRNYVLNQWRTLREHVCLRCPFKICESFKALKIRIQAFKIRIQAFKIRIQAFKIRIQAFKIRIQVLLRLFFCFTTSSINFLADKYTAAPPAVRCLLMSPKIYVEANLSICIQ